MKQIILGTAGHIDHGKTSLIKALTGTDTDRLKEEKLRGITIELGFAALDLPSGQHVGIVDVPGHEKFIKNMVAGATGIDIVVMVIAADEGVMPQTREHMEICTLLGIRHGFIALTKIDMVDAEWLELAQEDIMEFAEGTFLEGAPVVPVSSVSGTGLPEFIKTLDEIAATVPDRPSTGLFRLPADRVFSMKGFGTVITGTLVSGNVSVGETIMIYPSMITSKVRGIQVHNASVTEARAGMRTAINFQGLDRAAVNRGDMVSTPGALKPTYMLDVALHFLESNQKPLKPRTRIRFHAGTSEVLGNLVLLDRDELAPGEDTVAQLRLDEPVTGVRDDRYVVRSYSPVRTIGGGRIVNPIPHKHKRLRPEVIQGLHRMMSADPAELLAYLIETAGYEGVSFGDLKLMTNLPDKQLTTLLQAQLSSRAVIQVDKENRLFIHQATYERLKSEALENLERYHGKNPLKAGMPKEELKSKFPRLSPKLFTLLLNQMLRDDEIAQAEETIRLASHTVSLGIDQADVRHKLLDIYLESDLQPPYFKEIAQSLAVTPAQAREVLTLLVDEGSLVKVKEDLYFHTRNLERLKERLVAFLNKEGEISTPQFKDMTGASRKYVIPLIEHFDTKNVTIRIGDIRKLRRG
ncbi:MAG: selenocysteine-specific translation elongation factor [Desulfobacterales bacterium]